MKQYFKMDFLKTVLNLVQKRRFCNFDRSKGCLYAYPNLSKPQKIHAFLEKQGISMNFVPFGPMSATRVFTKIVAVVASCLRQKNLCLAVFLDDWLGLNAMRNRLLQDLLKMINLLIQLGFMINAAFTIHNLFRKGVQSQVRDSISISRQAYQNYTSNSDYVEQTSIDSQRVYNLLGLMSSCVETVSYARLYMRPVQLHPFLETKFKRSAFPNPVYKTCSMSFVMVVTTSKCARRQIFSTLVSKPHSKQMIR
jgi:hypothetical protein